MFRSLIMMLDVDRQPATAYKHLEKTPWPLAKTPANSKMGFVMFKLQSYVTLNHFQPICIPLFTCPESTRRATWLKPRPRHPWPAHRITSMPLGFSHLSRYFTKDCQVTFIYPTDSMFYSQLDFHLWLTQLPRKWWIFNWQASWT